MRKKRYKIWLIIILVLIVIGIGLKTLFRKGESSIIQESGKVEGSAKSIKNFNVSQISKSNWNTPDGIPYKQVPGANLGATSFQILDQNRIAFLCNSSNEIIITDKTTGKAIQKFQVLYAPRDFVYNNDKFYVLSEYEVTEYDDNGNEIVKYSFPMTYQGVEKLIRFNDATYLLLPEGNSLMIEDCGEPIEPVEFKGTITEDGYFISSKITGNNSYSICISFSVENTKEKTYSTDKKTAGVFIVGATENRIFLDVQTFISENPISVERVLISIDLSEKELGSIKSKTIVPNSYYVISNKDFYVTETGNVYNMITSPKGVFIFFLTETKPDNAQGYPSTLTDNPYNSNDDLIKIN